MFSKSTIGMSRIEWFGRIFTPNGVSADPNKIRAIIEAGRPQSIADIRSFLMACQYNAKFAFDGPSVPESYEQITMPLRELFKKDAKFEWTKNEKNLTTNSLRS